MEQRVNFELRIANFELMASIGESLIWKFQPYARCFTRNGPLIIDWRT